MDKPKTVQVTEPHQLFNLVQDTTLDIKNIRICTDDILEVSYKSINEDAPASKKTNIFIAGFTTAQAASNDMRFLEKLDRQVLYYDTDSVI